MEFKKEINILENTNFHKDEFMTSLGSSSVLLTALDTLEVVEDDSVKEAPMYLKAIARYIAAYTDSSYFIKLRNPNNDNLEDLSKYIESNHIKLIIDINTPKEDTNSINIVPLNKVDETILKELKEALLEENINDVLVANNKTNINQIDYIKIEIPELYRNNLIELEKVCEGLVNFIKQYINIVD